MKIETNAIYRSKIDGEGLVMPFAVLGNRVFLYIGQQFGARTLFIHNRRATMTRSEFEESFERDDGNGEA